jgi:hypothetical protein
VSDQTKLEFSEWLKVRDVLEELLTQLGDTMVQNGQLNGKETAEELMATGLIDVAAILGYEPEPDDVEEIEADEWKATHLWRFDDRPPLRVAYARAVGQKFALVVGPDGTQYKAAIDALDNIVSPS